MAVERFPERNRLILEMAAADIPYREIAWRLGTTKQAVQAVVKRDHERRGGPPRRRGPRGKIDTLMRAKMIRLYVDREMSAALVAAELGVSESTVLTHLREAGVQIRPQRKPFLSIVPTAKPFSPPPAARVWCVQCERNVVVAEAENCARPFCKAKAVAA